MTVLEDRRIGMEQEFFLVDADGVLADRADEFLTLYRKAARAAGWDPHDLAPECARCMVEIDVPPAYSLAELSREYLNRLQLALSVGRELGLRLYPLATYPLDVGPVLRDESHYWIQARTVGPERFTHAGRCAGAHLHLEVMQGTVDPRVGVSYDAPRAAHEELLNLYNLATALDAAIVALTRSCPYYAGKANGLAMRTAHYRGDLYLAPHGLYAWFEEVGGLRPYAGSVEELVELQFSRYHAWLEAIDRAGVERRLLSEIGGGLLKGSSWNPVRINPLGTVELRGLDSNYPEKILAVGALVSAAAERVRRERLTVLPHGDVRAFEVVGETLLVPGFDYLNRDLFRAAMTGGAENKEVASYLDSILGFARAGRGNAEEDGFETLKVAGRYQTTEAEILQSFAPPASGLLSNERGLELVREACDELEKQVASLRHQKATKAGVGGD
ncbi:MAG TPA: glutamate-cysteine ligase family protein [Rubrobacteraceae bacterium]|nr:glutamate-cysteine ligase family protein [Rubrobacteraceae bacterium]